MASDESQSPSSEDLNMGLGKLRLGFKLSILTIAFFVASPLYGLGLGLGLGVIAIYMLTVYQRAAGWRLLGFKETRTMMLVCGVFMTVYPLYLLFFGLLLSGYLIMLSATGLIFWIPLFAWALYTYVENRSAKELEKMLHVNLWPPRIFALVGIVAFVVGEISSLIFLRNQTLFLPFAASAAASPFLIISCVFFIRRLKFPIETSEKV
jgi:hypothetical protein